MVVMRSLLVCVLVVPLLGGCSDGETAEPGPRLREAGASAATDAGDQIDPPDAGVPEDSGSISQEPEQSGEATYYNAEGLGACGIPTPPDYLVAAINDEQYSKANCGRCVSVTGPKGTVTVRIIDKCPGCDSGDLDLSETAFSKIANKSAGRVKITWRFVDCPF
jgi:hypothetical protein